MVYHKTFNTKLDYSRGAGAPFFPFLKKELLNYYFVIVIFTYIYRKI